MNYQASTDQHEAVLSHPHYDHVFYFRLHEGCNLYCEHCFIPSNPSRISESKIPSYIQSINHIVKPHERIMVQLHGGEPSLYGAERIAELVDDLKNEVHCRRVDVGLQTNLINFSDELLDVYRRKIDDLGISWDSDIRRTKKYDASSVEEYEKLFWKNHRTLFNNGITPYLIMTGTRLFFERFKRGYDLFEFLADRNIEKAHIERLTKTGNAIENWGRLGVNNQEYSSHMQNLALRYLSWKSNNPFSKLSMSPFDGLVDSVKSLNSGEASGYGCWSGHCDKGFHTFGADGYSAGCTALTSTDNYEPGAYAVIRLDRVKNCHECRFKRICSSGCLETELYDGSGECSGAYGLFDVISNALNMKEG